MIARLIRTIIVAAPLNTMFDCNNGVTINKSKGGRKYLYEKENIATFKYTSSHMIRFHHPQ